MPETILDVAPIGAEWLLDDSDGYHNPAAALLLPAFTNLLVVGKDNLVPAANQSSVHLYDTSAIPLGATVSRAKLELRCQDGANTGAVNLNFGIMNSPRLGKFTSNVHSMLVSMDCYTGIFGVQIWALSNTAINSTSITIRGPGTTAPNGITGVAQAWTCTNTGTYGWSSVRMQREGSISAGTTLSLNVYATTGGPGAYVRGALIGTLGPVTALSAISTVTWTTNKVFLPGSAINVVSGTTYISEITMAGNTLSGGIRIATNNVGDSSNNHALTYGTLQGFGDVKLFKGGASLEALPSFGTPDVVAAPVLATNELHSFGDASYTVGTTLPNFTSQVQAALDARPTLERWLGVQVRSDATLDNRYRTFHSRRSGVVTSNAKSGMLLHIVYEAGKFVLAGSISVGPGRVYGAAVAGDRVSGEDVAAERASGAIGSGERLSSEHAAAARLSARIQVRGNA